jgi:hypothetical protein
MAEFGIRVERMPEYIFLKALFLKLVGGYQVQTDTWPIGCSGI